jgi:hypothetical protein
MPQNEPNAPLLRYKQPAGNFIEVKRHYSNNPASSKDYTA